MSKTLFFAGPQRYQARALQLYEDPEVFRLQRQIKHLREELAELQQAKNDVEQQIQRLNTRHHRELRTLVVELLELRRNYRRNTDTADPEPAEPEADPSFSADKQEEISDRLPKLSLPQRRALKETFRQASKLCHPDLVATEFKAEANVIFIELKTAYEQHNLLRVEEILHLLKRGEKLAGTAPLSHSKENLQAEVRYLGIKIQTTRHELETLKESSSYRKLVSIEDWDDYFDDLKAELQRKINRLKRKKHTSRMQKA